MKLIYTGKAKEVYEYESDVLIKFTNNATAFNGEKHDVIQQKGAINNKISILIFEYLEKNGIKTHFKKQYSEDSQVCQKVNIIPLEIIIRNVVAGSMAKRLGINEGTTISKPIFELSYKNDSLGDPLINDDHAICLGAATTNELEYIRQESLKINELLKQLFKKCNLNLIDFKLEFGVNNNGELLLADEFSPDNCRLWEIDTNEKFDKDRFRRDLGNVMFFYNEVLNRLLEVLCE